MSDLHFNFEAALLIACIVTGIAWSLDKFYLAPRRRAGDKADKKPSRAPWAIDFCRSFFPVILAVLLLRSFVVEPFRIPSGSMVPTLLIGDFILVNKFDYGLRLPVFHTKIIPTGEPERGDVAVFRYPRDTSKDYIKRIIGLPGDHIVYRDNHLFINGKQVPRTAEGIYNGPDAAAYEVMQEYSEKLGDHQHNFLVMPDRRHLEAGTTVPAGHYFVMGDNRDNSADSRVWGFVPEKNLVGKAFLIWLSVDKKDWTLRFGRIGSLID